MRGTLTKCDWQVEWDNVTRPRSVDQREDRFWDFMATEGTHLLAIDRSLDASIVDFLCREGILLPGHCVLDVGAGLGNYSFLFAPIAEKVHCLDISPCMVRSIRARAECEGVVNIEASQGSWDDFQSPRMFDLVFSSFCPAVEGHSSLLKMESMSQGHCCYVGLSGSNQDETEEEIWSKVHGGSLPEHGHEAILPFNLLYRMGRHPSLRTFSSMVSYHVSEETLCEYYLRHISRMTKLGQGAERIIREVVHRRCEDGVLHASGEISVAMIYWRAPR